VAEASLGEGYEPYHDGEAEEELLRRSAGVRGLAPLWGYLPRLRQLRRRPRPRRGRTLFHPRRGRQSRILPLGPVPSKLGIHSPHYMLVKEGYKFNRTESVKYD